LLFTGGEPTARAQAAADVPAVLLISRDEALGHLTFIAVATATTAARVAVDVAKGYRIDTGGRPAGSPIGSVAFLQGDLESTTSTLLTGRLAVSSASTFASDTAAQACDPGPHLAVWQIDLTSQGKTTTLPVFLDAPPTEVQADAAYRIQFCPPPATSVGFVGVLGHTSGTAS
jgi:hypothetical protein